MICELLYTNFSLDGDALSEYLKLFEQSLQPNDVFETKHDEAKVYAIG